MPEGSHLSHLRPASRRVALIVAAAFFMQLLDGAIMNTSLPQMAVSFGVLPLDLSVGITLYMLSAAAFVPISGWLADRIGPRRVFLCAILAFTAASLACGLAQTLLQFVIARALQGVAGAMMVPVGRLIVLRGSERSELVYVTALLTWPALSAPIIGPALGGYLTAYHSWRWNFFINVPLGLLGLLLVMRYVPLSKAEHRHPLDWRGFILSALAMVLLLYGLELLSHLHSGWLWQDWAQPLALIAAGAIALALSIRHLQRSERPLLDLSAAKVQTFRLATLTAGAAYRIAIQATPFLLPLLFQLGFGLDALQAGSLLLLYFAGNMGMKPFTTGILRRFGFRQVMIYNGVLLGLSVIVCSALSAHISHWILAPVLVLAGATRSMHMTAMNTLAFADITPQQKSTSSTLVAVIDQSAVVMAVALSTLVLNLALMSTSGPLIGARELQIGLVCAGLLAMLAAPAYARLPRNAGAEVSGHRG